MPDNSEKHKASNFRIEEKAKTEANRRRQQAEQSLPDCVRTTGCYKQKIPIFKVIGVGTSNVMKYKILLTNFLQIPTVPDKKNRTDKECKNRRAYRYQVYLI
jgi:hypothetical protein